MRRTIEGESPGLFNAAQVVDILRTFETPESRLVALKQLIGLDDRAAKRVYGKIEGSVNLQKWTDQDPKKRARASLQIASFFLFIALIDLAYSAISPRPTPPTVTAPVERPIVAPSQPDLEPSDLLGTWQCIDPNTQKLLKTVKFDANFTYMEWRGNKSIQGNYEYNKQTKELSFVSNGDIMEIGRVKPINHTAFEFEVRAGYTPTLPPGLMYEFRR